MSWTRVFDRNKPWIKNPDCLTTVLIYDRIAIPVVYLLDYLNIPPNLVTIAGLIAGFIGIYYFFNGSFLLGSLMFFIWFLSDCIDGKLARKSKKTSKIGERLDFLGGHILTNIGYLSFIFFPKSIYLSLFTTILVLYRYFNILISMSFKIKYKPKIKYVSSYLSTHDEGFIIFVIGPAIFQNFWTPLLISETLSTLHLLLGKEKVKEINFSKNLRILINKFFK